MLFELIWAYFGKAILGYLLFFAGTGITGYGGYMGYKAIFSKNVDYIRDWVRHIFIYGTTGSGKTTIALKLYLKLVSDIRRFGALIIAPDSETVNRYLSITPDEREKDVVIIKATDQWPIGCNLAFSRDLKEHEIHLYADDVVEIIRHLYKDNAWGDIIAEGVRMAAMAVLEFGIKTKAEISLIDTIKFLNNDSFRKKVLEYVSNYFVKDYWDTYKFEGNDFKKLVIRFRKPLVSPYMLECLCQKENFDLINAVNENKIIILQLGGQLGEADSKLLASMFFSKFLRAVHSERIKVKFFQFFCDEMHLYLSLLGDNIESALATIRKFRISLVLITQGIFQLTDRLKGAIGLCNTKHIFPPTEEDIAELVRMFKDYEIKAKTLRKLKTGQSVSVELIGGEKHDPKIQYHKMVEPKDYPKEKVERIKELSRQKYGTPRQLVKEYIRAKLFDEMDRINEPVKDLLPISNIIPLGGAKKNDNRKRYVNPSPVSPFEVP